MIFDLPDGTFEDVYMTILRKNVKAIYAYTSGVLLFLQFLQKRGYRLDLKAIYKKSELFIPNLRPLARE